MNNQEKIAVVEAEIKELKRQMYPLEVRGKIAHKLADKELAANCTKELERLYKYVDAYKEELSVLRAVIKS